MKRTLFLTVAAAATWAVAAQSAKFAYEDREKNLSVVATEGRGERTTTGYHLFLKGNVVATSKGRATEIRSQQLEGDITAGKGPGELKNAIATGKVQILKNAETAQGRQTTTIEGTRANYRTTPTASVIDLTGPVRIRNTDSAKKQTLDATGARGTATLEPGKKSKTPSAIKFAELMGNVRVVVSEAQSQGRSRLVATGGRMRLDETTSPRTITLFDNVQMNGEGQSSGFQLRNQKRVVLKLNDANEISSWTTEAGK